jgi:hypothetical protein
MSITALATALESGIEPIEATETVRALEEKLAKANDALVEMTRRFNDEAVAHKKTCETLTALRVWVAEAEATGNVHASSSLARIDAVLAKARGA